MVLPIQDMPIVVAQNLCKAYSPYVEQKNKETIVLSWVPYFKAQLASVDLVPFNDCCAVRAK